ncbi:hypothetical protein [Streptomyces catenulae]|uniref:Uncharacterized protein n=1 Tax=Streptomyces catenulae TaxID=66875 RepID=A0ABV2YXF0_9ACTN|nr:hypothetical protein [Streptomyces catenulae]
MQTRTRAHTPAAPTAPRRRFTRLSRAFACAVLLTGFGVAAFGLSGVAGSLGYAGTPGTLTVQGCREVAGRSHGQNCFGPVRAKDGTLLDEEAALDAELRPGDRVAVRGIAAFWVSEGRQHLGEPGLIAGAGILLSGFWVPYLTTGTFPWRTTPPPGAPLCTLGPRARLTRTVLCTLGACVAGACVIASLL